MDATSRSPCPLIARFAAAIASIKADGGAYNQSDATGFIRLQALPLRVHARRAAILGKG